MASTLDSAPERQSGSIGSGPDYAAAQQPGQHLRPDRAADGGTAVHLPVEWSPHRIAAHLHLARCAFGKVLARYRMPRLACLEPGAGLPMRKPALPRYEHDHPGNLIHVDIKKLGRIPDGGGCRTRRGLPDHKLRLEGFVPRLVRHSSAWDVKLTRKFPTKEPYAGPYPSRRNARPSDVR